MSRRKIDSRSRDLIGMQAANSASAATMLVEYRRELDALNREQAELDRYREVRLHVDANKDELLRDIGVLTKQIEDVKNEIAALR